MIAKFFGIVDLISAIIIAGLQIPIIGSFKWLLVAVLVYKGIISLF